MKKLKIYFLFFFIAFNSLGQKNNEPRIWEVNPGDDYKAVLNQVQPGDELVLHEGIYEGALVITKSGLPGKPITIRGNGNEERPVLLLESRGNLMQINASNIILEFLELRSKSGYAIRIGTSKEASSYNNIIIKNCVFYESGGGDISANSSLSYDNIQILDNYFIGPKTTPVYIGIHDGKAKVTNFLFKGNVIDGSVNDGSPSTTGYGIQLKLNVTGGIIENNYITNTKGPCIMVYGSENANPENANIVRNNIVVGSRNSAGIVVGGGPSRIEGNLTIGCNGGITTQNYGGRNLLHNIVINKNTAVCDRNYGISFGNIEDITARNNTVITENSSAAYRNNPASGNKNKVITASKELENRIQEELIKIIPARNNLDKIWKRVSAGPLSQADVMKITDLILEYKIPVKKNEQ